MACWISNLHATVVRLVQIGENFEQRRLAATRGTYHGDERTFGDVERDVGYCQRIKSLTTIGLRTLRSRINGSSTITIRYAQASQRSRLARTKPSSLRSACAT
jgi:hypothetical protein